MKVKDVRTIIRGISEKILSFEDGDIIMASEIQDDLLRLAANVQSLDLLIQTVAVVYHSISPVFVGENLAKYEEQISKGLDLVQRGLQDHSQTDDLECSTLTQAQLFDELLHSELTAFLKDHTGYTQKKLPLQEVENLQAPEKKKVSPVSKDRNWAFLESPPFQTFTFEAKERLIQAQEILLELDTDFEGHKEEVHDLFRFYHTIKGEAGLFDLPRIGSLSHSMETLLDGIRSNEIEFDNEIADILLQAGETIQEMITLLENRSIQDFLEVDVSPLLDTLQGIVNQERRPLGKILIEEGLLSKDELDGLVEKQSEGHYRKRLGELALQEGKVSQKDLSKSLVSQRIGNKVKKKTKKEDLIHVKAVDIGVLNDLVQELWIAENQIITEKIYGIKKVTKEIQDVVMRLRTVKIKNLFTKIKFILRDLSSKLEKPIDSTFIGEDLEVDRNLVESLEEPLIHILRNSMDHGIESREKRKELGKPEKGQIEVKAERKGNRIVLSIRDDGRGLDKEKILAKAIDNELITAEEGHRLYDSKIYELIFQPGFSTAEQVSQVSGRGVGMDVVNSMVQETQGKINIRTELGDFTEIKLIFPLNIAIIEGLVMACGDYHFVVPVSDVVECIQLQQEYLSTVQNKVNVIRLRGEVIPVLDMESIFRNKQIDESNKRVAVIVLNDKKKYAILVDKVIEKSEVALKNLGKKLSELRGISSGTVFSGGRIGYILDIDELVQYSEVLA